MPSISRLSKLSGTLKTPRPSKGLFILMIGLIAPLLIAACGGDDPTAAPRATATSQPPPVATATQPAPDPTSTTAPEVPAASTVAVSSQGPLGRHLVDADGMALYLYTKDERNISNCSAGCAEAWPPLMAGGDPVAGEGIDAARLGAIEREDGGSQVTYNGKPLYYFANDTKAGDTLGQDRGGVWFVVSPDGGPIRTTASVTATESAGLGTFLADPSGNALYLYTKDEREVSNCSGGCALAWPPLLTVEDPLAGEGLAEDRIGATTRADGSKQVTYNGWPLYYFAADEKPGDTLGQDRGGVWFVLTTDGGAIYTNAPINAAEAGDMGSILVDAAGRSLYLYTKDDPGVSNCSGGCALAWPPLITVSAPAPGDGVSAARIGTATRADGSKQVTFDGWPLYYFAADQKPGDTTGQNRGEVWYVINNSNPVMIAMGAQNDSGQTGTAVLAGRGNFTNVSVTLTAGTLETELAHIHEGRCVPGDLGGVVHALTSFAGGSGSSVTNVATSLGSLTTGGFAINTHKAGEASVYTSCGNIAAAGDSLSITLDELNGSGQSGFATLTARGGQTEVVVSATAGISALAHIHSGSCATLGGVVHALADTSGGISSTTVDATLESLINGDFAINLHTAGAPSVYSSCGDI
ncbi:MAG: CHRD domain-containing protein [Chloroflexi bacterium]|nr:CHRD domain-containing protein [Chloroflexota bacterium]MDA1272234.1 CHRD domain-containing protein [Chloroflexota bacterium]